jgi:2-oxoisovalerate dehydrogenase E1 component beta subunit
MPTFPILTVFLTPVALQYEKFHIPDAIRVLDAMIENLQY